MKHIDDTFKQLENDIFQVPDSFLEDLNQRLDDYIPEKKKGRGWFFWVILSGIILSGIIGMTQIVGNKSTNPKIANVEQLNPANGNEKTTVNKNNNVWNNTNHSFHPIDSNNLEERNTLLQENEKSDFLGSASNESLLSTGTIVNSKKIYSTSLDNSLKATKNEQKVDGVFKGKAKKPQHRLITRNLDPELLQPSSTKKSASHQVDEQPALQTEDEITKNSNSNSSTDSINKITTNNQRFAYLSLNKKAPVFPEINMSLEQSSEPAIVNKDLSSIPSEKKWNYDLQIYGSVSQAFWKMKAADNFTTNEVNRTPILSSTFGIKGNAFYKNLNTSVGLEYYQSNQKLKFNTKTQQQTGIDSSFSGYVYDTIYIDSTTWFYDSTAVYQFTSVFDSISKEHNQRNTYTWLSIPISFGYRFNYQSWSFIPRVGINLNFGIAENRGSYPTSGFNIQEHEAVRFNTDIMIQTEIRKNFNKIHVFFTPYYRGNLNPMLKTNAFTISHQSWGVNFGVGIDL